MSRNEIKYSIIKIIQDPSIGNNEKDSRITQVWKQSQGDFVGKKNKKLIEEIERRTGYELMNCKLLDGLMQ